MNTNDELKQTNTRIVYSRRIAAELIKLGHIVMMTQPNPDDPKYIS